LRSPAEDGAITVVLPEQQWSTDADLRLDPDFPLINVFAAVHTGADSDDALAELIPAGAGSWI
jgi:hypothetical protein